MTVHSRPTIDTGCSDESILLCEREARERREYGPLLARLPGADTSLLTCDVRGAGQHDDMVAELLAPDYPEHAAAIWQELAGAWIAGGGYGEAMQTLRKLRRVMGRTGHEAAWRAYIEGLRAAGRRRPRLVAALDTLLAEG